MLDININKIVGGTFIIVTLWYSTTALGEPFESKIKIEVDVSKADVVRLDIPVGQLRILGTTGQTVIAEALVTCSKSNGVECNNNIFEKIGWSSNTEDGRVQLGLTPSSAGRYNDISMAVNIRVPENKMLEVDLDYGDLSVHGTNACLDVNVKAGNVKLGLKEKSLASASLKATAGNVDLITSGETTHGRRSNIVGSELEWSKGIGICRVHAAVLTGNIQLVLE